jgi:periplasmic divalent cation tolerance protein
MKLLITTVPPADADGIIGPLLEERLIACANFVSNVRSRYWWRGALEQADETIVLMKTTDELASRTVARLAELHPYDVPEAVVLDIADGWGPYLSWIGEVTAAQ